MTFSKKTTYLFLLFCWAHRIQALGHASRLNLLKNKGFNPHIVYDIGAHQGEWTTDIKKIFSSAQYFLFEANKCHEPYLKKVGFPYYFALLGNSEKLVTFYAINSTGDSMYPEQTTHYMNDNCKQKIVPMTTLDSLVKEHNLPKPDLIKMDVQGAEKLIIEGGVSVICNAEVIILEVGILEYNKNAPLFNEMVAFMNHLGYRVLDFVELHYLPDTQELFEIDILFIKNDSRLIRRGLLG